MKGEGTQKIRFDGRLECGGGSFSRFTVVGSFPENDFTTLDLEILWHGDLAERRRGEAALLGKTNDIWLLNDDSSGGHVELIGLTGFSTEYGGPTPISTLPQFSALQYDIDQVIRLEDRNFYVAVRLVPSGLLSGGIHGRSYTGELTIEPVPWRTPIKIETRYGELLVSETFNFESYFESGNKVTKRVPQTTISGEIVVPRGSSLYEVNEGLYSELEAVRVALGLCYRQTFRIVQVSYTDQVERQRKPAYYRRRVREAKGKVEVECFIDSRNLGDGGLQELAAAIRSARDSADLIRAINFLSASYESDLETAFFMAFSAMETVINHSVAGVPGLGYSAASWKTIRRATEEALSKVAKELQIEEKDLLGKIPELKRPSFRRRLSLACAVHKPTTGDIWPGRDFLDGMSEAASIRNGLFHAAKYSDGNALSDSLIRIRTLTERLVAKLLKWPDQDLWVHRDSLLRSLNVGYAERALLKGNKAAPKGNAPEAEE